ncbi:hypothetical protein RSOLAG22IIIB_05778 [Rhizoctonia solani]|uniref:Uncharacterized protein n=1 Tax=Rhizoctonia solani TaxID=456999 RepID=A0A0K6G9R2_9AGAM|nr:unnamed protein product [Rhizoctonia solani]CUA75210.1 hypothetical protein RSOLAG22IIIB_05778 [Rhizoctonia solani]
MTLALERSSAQAQKNAPPSRSKRDHVEVDDEESDNELVSKKINRRESHTLSDSEPAPKSSTARRATKSASKNTEKKGKEPAKSAGRKNQSPTADDLESEPEKQKATKGLNIRANYPLQSVAELPPISLLLPLA